MLKKIKIWQLIFAFTLILIIIRFKLLVYTACMICLFIEMLFSNLPLAAEQLNFAFIDHIISFSIILVPPLIFYKRKSTVLNGNADILACVIIILAFFFIYAPLVSSFNPDFQKDLTVTELLPPLSSIKVLHLKEKYKVNDKSGNFFDIKKLVIKNSFDNNIIFADSISVGNDVNYYRGNQKNRISINKIQMRGGLPIVSSNFYLLGTDELGRDIFSRLVYGARVSLFVGFGSIFVSFWLGLSLGFIAGYFGGIVGSLLNRLSEMFLVFPILFLIILILALFGNSLISIIIVLGFSGWMSLFKIVRGEVISLKGKDFFMSSKLIGLPLKDLLIKEALPVIIAPVLVNLVFQYGSVILAEAALSYLGLGTGNIYPSWGAMIESGQSYISQAWWMIFFPGLFITLTLYSVNSLGKKLQTLYNPRLKYD